MRLPSVIRAEAHRSHGLADARSNKTSSDNEMAKFATALAQRDQPFIVLAPGKTNGADKLLAWLVGNLQSSHAWQDANVLRRMRFSRVFWIALWTVYNSASMRTSLGPPRSWSCTHSLSDTVMGRMETEVL